MASPTIIRHAQKNGIFISVSTVGHLAYVQTYSTHIEGRTILEGEQVFSTEAKAITNFIAQLKTLNA